MAHFPEGSLETIYKPQSQPVDPFNSSCLTNGKVAFCAAGVFAIIAGLALSAYLCPDYSGLDWVRTAFVNNNTALILGAFVASGISLGSLFTAFHQLSTVVEESPYLTDEFPVTPKKENPSRSSVVVQSFIMNDQTWKLTVLFEGPTEMCYPALAAFNNLVFTCMNNAPERPFVYLKWLLETAVNDVEKEYIGIRVITTCTSSIGVISNMLQTEDGNFQNPKGFTVTDLQKKATDSTVD